MVDNGNSCCNIVIIGIIYVAQMIQKNELWARRIPRHLSSMCKVFIVATVWWPMTILLNYHFRTIYTGEAILLSHLSMWLLG